MKRQTENLFEDEPIYFKKKREIHYLCFISLEGFIKAEMLVASLKGNWVARELLESECTSYFELIKLEF